MLTHIRGTDNTAWDGFSHPLLRALQQDTKHTLLGVIQISSWGTQSSSFRLHCSNLLVCRAECDSDSLLVHWVRALAV